jgi:hypothetical protein
VESGNWYLPHPLLVSWVEPFIGVWKAFPAGAHDDQVDARSQGAKRLLTVGAIGSVTRQCSLQGESRPFLMDWTKPKSRPNVSAVRVVWKCSLGPEYFSSLPGIESIELAAIRSSVVGASYWRETAFT